MVLDRTPSGNFGVSIVVRKEDIRSWAWELEQFPDPPYDMYALTRLSGQLRYRLSDVSLAPGIEEDGRPVEGWHCNTLLEAMYLMVYLNLKGGAKLQECASHDCYEYFRPGPQETIYCSPEHQSRATTRRLRGQAP
jgi:hypothetical protein